MAEKMHDEYEIVSMSPIRRLEKRVEQIESSPSVDNKDFFKDLVDIIRLNQQIVDEMAKANDSLRLEISRIPSRLEQLTNALEELLSYIKAAAVEEATTPSPSSLQPLLAKFDELIASNKKIAEMNESVMSTVSDLDRKLKKPVMPVMRRPVMQQRPMGGPI